MTSAYKIKEISSFPVDRLGYPPHTEICVMIDLENYSRYTIKIWEDFFPPLTS